MRPELLSLLLQTGIISIQHALMLLESVLQKKGKVHAIDRVVCQMLAYIGAPAGEAGNVLRVAAAYSSAAVCTRWPPSPPRLSHTPRCLHSTPMLPAPHVAFPHSSCPRLVAQVLRMLLSWMTLWSASSSATPDLQLLGVALAEACARDNEEVSSPRPATVGPVNSHPGTCR